MTTREEFKSLLGDQSTAVNEEQPQALYDYTTSQPSGLTSLKYMVSLFGTGNDIQNSPERLVNTRNAIANDTYSHTDYTNGSILNLWLYQRIHIVDATANRMIDINPGGFAAGFAAGLPAGTSL